MKARKRTHGYTFALKAWTVKTENGHFFISPTGYFDEPRRWRGPYKTLQHATTAIARKLDEEFKQRQKRWEGVQ